MKKIFGIEVTDEYFDYLFQEQSQGKEIKVVDGKVVAVERITTEKELIQLEINKLTEKLYLTDYIANKLAEAVSKYISTSDNTDVLLLREKYALELANREEWRKEIDKLQQELKLLDK